MFELPLWRLHKIINVDFYTLTLVNLIISIQLVLAVVYTVLTGATVPGIKYFVIPFIWINVAGWAIIQTSPIARKFKHRAVAFGIASVYFLFILFLSGLLRPGTTSLAQITGMGGFSVTWRSIGWGPTLLYSGEWFEMVLIPYQVIGYLALAYLLYATVLDMTPSAFGGVLGLLPCPGCAAPLITSLIAGVAGTSSAVALLVSYQYELATVLFVASIALLSRR